MFIITPSVSLDQLILICIEFSNREGYKTIN